MKKHGGTPAPSRHAKSRLHSRPLNRHPHRSFISRRRRLKTVCTARPKALGDYPDTLRSAPARQQPVKAIERPQKIWRHKRNTARRVFIHPAILKLRPLSSSTGMLPCPAGRTIRKTWMKSPDCRPGPIPGLSGEEPVFRTIGRHGLFEKLAGVDQRFKYRIRVYKNGDKVIHLEKKMKTQTVLPQ
jgi:hypothetical protein